MRAPPTASHSSSPTRASPSKPGSCCTSSTLHPRYTDTFVRHEIDLPTFVTLTDEELKEIGIPTFGARKKLLLLGKEAGKKLAQGQ